MTIKSKFIATLSLMVGAVVLVALLSVQHTRENARFLTAIRDGSVPVAMAAQEAASQFRKYSNDVEVGLSLREPQIVSDNRPILRAINEQLRLIEGLAPALGAAPEKMAATIAEFQSGTEAFVRLSVEDKTDRGELAKSGKVIGTLNAAILAHLEQLNWSAKASLAKEIEVTRAYNRRTSIIYPGIFVVVTIAVVLMAMFILRSIMMRMRLLQDHFAAADLDTLEPMDSTTNHDELDSLVEATNQMLASFKLSRADLIDKAFVDNVIATLVDLLIVVDAEGLVKRYNPTAIKALGYSEAGFRSLKLNTIIYDEKIAPLSEEAWARTRNGTVLIPGGYIKRADGTILPVLISAAPMTDRNGAFTGVVLSLKDRTEIVRGEEEKKKIESQLQHASKLASLGTLGAGVAHELNNPLVAVKGFAQMLLADHSDTTDLTTKLKKIIIAAERMQRITDHLRAFASDTSNNPFKPISVNAAVRDSLILLDSQARQQRVDVVMNLDDALPLVIGDPTQLESVFQNLIANSIDAFKEGRSTGARTITFASATDGDNILVRYTDTAGGVPDAAKSRIFDPFFTTKEVGKGTGLGLSISHDVVQKHGGTVALVPSTAGTACFEVRIPIAKGVTLPRLDASNVDPPVALVRPAPTRVDTNGLKKPRLLIVDDDTDVLDVLRGFLEKSFELDLVSDPRVACERIGVERYEGIVTDMRMPGMTGLEVLAVARKKAPGTPTAVITGHAKTEADAKEMSEAGATLVLPKPFPSADVVVERFTILVRSKLRPQKFRVLVVDDEEDICMILSAYLERDFDVMTCLESEKALTILDNEIFDLVLTDLGMPIVTGKDLILHIRMTNDVVPVLAITGSDAASSYALEALAAGATAIVTKPFAHQAEFLAMIHGHINSTRNRAA